MGSESSGVSFVAKREFDCRTRGYEAKVKRDIHLADQSFIYPPT